MKPFSLFVLILLHVNISLAQNKESVMDSLAATWQLSTGSMLKCTYFEQFKSAIAEDTSRLTIIIYLKATSATDFIFRMDYLNQDSTIDKSIFGCSSCKKYYELYPKAKEYIVGSNVKKTSYLNVLESLPILNTALQEQLQQSKYLGFHKKKHVFLKTGFISIGEDYASCESVTSSASNLGVQYGKLVVQQHRPSDSDQQLILDPLQAIAGYKLFEGNQLKSITQKDLGMQFSPGFLATLKSVDDAKPFYLLDLFYQSCLPCVASFPLLKSIHMDSSFANLQVIGVDPILKDTLHMQRFIKRYQLSYPIITGKLATDLYTTINNITYPTLLLIDARGILRYYHCGQLTDSQVNDIRKIIQK